MYLFSQNIVHYNYCKLEPVYIIGFMIIPFLSIPPHKLFNLTAATPFLQTLTIALH